MSKLIISRVPFRIPLGGGSTDLPSYYEKYGGFIFAVTINLYMDIFIKEPRSDDLFHVHYKEFEAVSRVEDIKHEIARQALIIENIKRPVAISFKADTPAGTGLGSSGACSVALLKGLAGYEGRKMGNIEAAEKSFILTRALNLPDGVQDPYVCANGGFVLLDIAKDGKVKIGKAKIKEDTTNRFFKNTIFFFTGVSRPSTPILRAQDKDRVLELKHRTKEIGYRIYEAFEKDNLDDFGRLMDEHWQVKKKMGQTSSPYFDKLYRRAKDNGALGGKLLGAGGGGYFMFSCPNEKIRQKVKDSLACFGMREMVFSIDNKGARTKTINF
jgi:D-glycero-alpha-D-manno-heptose-7-phosphate kinase